MPLLRLLPVVICGLAFAGAAPAQEDGGRLAAERQGIGRLETRIQNFGGALGVVSHFVRRPGADIECNAVCYFPSSTRPVAWLCAPGKPCVLHCLANPPVGGCE